MPTRTFGTHASVKCCRLSVSQIANTEDRFAVAIKRTGSVVGHVPFNLAPVVSAFLEETSTRD